MLLNDTNNFVLNYQNININLKNPLGRGEVIEISDEAIDYNSLLLNDNYREGVEGTDLLTDVLFNSAVENIVTVIPMLTPEVAANVLTEVGRINKILGVKLLNTTQTFVFDVLANMDTLKNNYDASTGNSSDGTNTRAMTFDSAGNVSSIDGMSFADINNIFARDYRLLFDEGNVVPERDIKFMISEATMNAEEEPINLLDKADLDHISNSIITPAKKFLGRYTQILLPIIDRYIIMGLSTLEPLLSDLYDPKASGDDDFDYKNATKKEVHERHIEKATAYRTIHPTDILLTDDEKAISALYAISSRQELNEKERAAIKRLIYFCCARDIDEKTYFFSDELVEQVLDLARSKAGNALRDTMQEYNKVVTENFEWKLLVEFYLTRYVDTEVYFPLVNYKYRQGYAHQKFSTSSKVMLRDSFWEYLSSGEISSRIKKALTFPGLLPATIDLKSGNNYLMRHHIGEGRIGIDRIKRKLRVSCGVEGTFLQDESVILNHYYGIHSLSVRYCTVSSLFRMSNFKVHKSISDLFSSLPHGSAKYNVFYTLCLGLFNNHEVLDILGIEGEEIDKYIRLYNTARVFPLNYAQYAPYIGVRYIDINELFSDFNSLFIKLAAIWKVIPSDNSLRRSAAMIKYNDEQSIAIFMQTLSMANQFKAINDKSKNKEELLIDSKSKPLLLTQ